MDHNASFWICLCVILCLRGTFSDNADGDESLTFRKNRTLMNDESNQSLFNSRTVVDRKKVNISSDFEAAGVGPAVLGGRKNESFFVCSNVTLNEGEYHILPNGTLYIASLKLTVERSQFAHSVNSVTVCKETYRKEKVEVIPEVLDIVLASFIYSIISFAVAWVCLTSIYWFCWAYVIVNFFTFFVMSGVLPGTLGEVGGALLPIHLNLMFFFVTGWTTLLSCKAVLECLKFYNFFGAERRKANVFLVAELNMFLACVIAVSTFLGNKTIFRRCSELHDEDFQTTVTQYAPAIFFLFSFVLAVDVMLGPDRRKFRNSRFKNTKRYSIFFRHHFMATLCWVLGFLAVSFPRYDQIWLLYELATMVLPIWLLADLTIPLAAKARARMESSAGEVFRIRVQHV